MNSATPALNLKDCYRTTPSNPYEVHALVAGLIGFPCHFHQHRLKTKRVKGKDYMLTYKDKIHMMWSDSDGGASALFLDEGLYYFVDDSENYIGFWFKESSTVRQKIAAIIAELESLTIPDPEPNSNPVARISLLLTDNTGALSEIRKNMYDWKSRPVEELKLLYDYDKFLSLVDFMQSGSGLAVLQGEPGTGKTSIIRDAIAKMAEYSDPTEAVYLTADNLKAIGSEQFIHYFLRNSGRCLICEDSEPVLQKNVDGIRSAATSNLLNLGDGVLGDMAETSIVCTLNCDMDKVDPALLRRGRCDLIWKVPAHTEDQIYKYWEYKHAQSPEKFRAPEKGLGGMTLANFNQIAAVIK